MSLRLKNLTSSKGIIKKINEKLQENDWEQELHGLSLSETWEILTEKLIKLIEENVPVRKFPMKLAGKIHM